MARSAIYPPSVQPGKPRLIFPPKGWCTVTFSDLFEVVERPAILDDTKEYQLITAKRSRGGIVPRERLRGRDILTKTQFYVFEGDFLISNRQIIHGGCGIVPPALDGAIVSNEYTVLRPRPILRPDFLSYLPHSIYFQQTCFHASVGVDVEKMVFDVDQWLTFKIHLPSVSEQESIAELLLGVDDAIQATLAVIQQTRKVKQVVLDRLLTKGIGHIRFKQTEIGEIPQAWEVRSLDELGQVQAGRQRSPHFTEGTLRPYLRVANVFDGFIDTSDVLQMNFTEAEYERYRLEPGDILLNEGQSLELVGRNAVYQGVPADCCFQNTLIRFRSGPDIQARFAYTLMQHLFSTGQFMAIATRTTSVAHLGVKRFANLLVPLPPKHEQLKISEIHAQFTKSLNSQMRKYNELVSLKAALLSDLLSGRKRQPINNLAAAE